MRLIALLRKQWCHVKYDQKFNPNWSDEQLLTHVIELVCSYRQLTSLPNLPNCRILDCVANQLTALPNLPNCQVLFCYDNQLTTLPDFPNCKELMCNNNQLTALPNLPKCERVCCWDNNLSSLPDLPSCQELRYEGNQLPFEKLEEWRRIWKIRETYLSLKYLRLWYKRMLQMKAQKKQNLHLELIWSPETKFYQGTEEYQHFLDHSQPK